MEQIKDPKSMNARSRELKKSGKRIAFVPTMGALHEGHLSLIDIAKKNGDIVVLSIYLNPTQFGEGEDLSKYPANLKRDLELANKRGVDIVFCPTNETIYPEGFQTFVETTKITKELCGASRPTHFRGVTTVVLKLFNIVEPDTAIFGQKDYQQLKVIEKMAHDLNLDIEMIGAPIIREEDGLAMSSRNAYLTPEERTAARSINLSIKTAHEMVTDGIKDTSKIIFNVISQIEEGGIGKVDYVSIVDPDTLEKVETIDEKALLAIAAFFGNARLIDNCILED